MHTLPGSIDGVGVINADDVEYTVTVLDGTMDDVKSNNAPVTSPEVQNIQMIKTFIGTKVSCHLTCSADYCILWYCRFYFPLVETLRKPTESNCDQCRFRSTISSVDYDISLPYSQDSNRRRHALL